MTIDDGLKAKIMNVGTLAGAIAGSAFGAYATHEFGGGVLFPIHDYFSMSTQTVSTFYYGLLSSMPGAIVGNEIIKTVLKRGYDVDFAKNPKNLITGI